MTKQTRLNQPLPPLRLYGAEEIAHSYSIGLTTFHNLRRAGVFPEPCRIGKRTLWTAEQVDAFVAKVVAGEVADIHVPLSKDIAAKDAAKAVAKSNQNQNG